MVSVTGPGKNGETLVLEPDVAEAVDAAEATETAVQAVIAAILEDANTDAGKYLEETEVPHGGE